MQYKLLNFFQARPVNSRQLKLLCDDRGSDYEILNFHTEICWLSRGKVWLSRGKVWLSRGKGWLSRGKGWLCRGKVLMAVFRLRIKLHFCCVCQKEKHI